MDDYTTGILLEALVNISENGILSNGSGCSHYASDVLKEWFDKVAEEEGN